MPAGRPTKINKPLIDAIKKVVDDNKVFICTDEDLVMLINKELHPKKISIDAFKRWKRGILPKTDKGSRYVAEFIHVIKVALYKEKENLFRKLDSGRAGEWQKYAWIIERKFSEWNLKTISENTNKDTVTHDFKVTYKEEDE